MIKHCFLLVSLFACYSGFAQQTEYRFYDPATDPAHVLEGRAWPDEVKDFYDRLPARAEKTVRKAVWDLSKNSAGLQWRFISDAPEIVVKYIVAGPLQMPHMPATGVSGVDLYAKDKGNNWLWAAGKYSFKDTIVYRFTGLSAGEKEYVLYLPLYNTVKWMQIAVPKQCLFTPLPAREQQPIIVYGTSIAQGGCASRPGLAWTNILGRKLEWPVVNLGFSGNGRLEPEIIDMLSEVDAKVYVLDCLPNLTGGYVVNGELRKRIVQAAQRLREKRPSTPILFVEHDGYTDGDINPGRWKDYTAANKILDQAIDSLRRKGVKGLYLLKNEAIGQDIESTVDGTHPNDIGMMHYADACKKAIVNIFKENSGRVPLLPALIPFPQVLKWEEGSFDVGKCKAIVVETPSVSGEARYLREELKKKGFAVPVTGTTWPASPIIRIRIDMDDTLPSEEAYRLKIGPQRILLTGKTSHGIFNGIQTLLQLMAGDKRFKACDITDWPAFSWRGYMVDAGRNYMSVDLLKQQIDVMAEHKLNVFHFHATEDIAWRFPVRRYPQLTAAGNMLRNKGRFYSEGEIRELIAYCKKRHIMFVPEIDMPGHSAAFRRAMGTDMQSDSGIRIVKNILEEIGARYDLPYIHIGADEVKITNRNFIPEVIACLEKLGKKVIGWQPGGNFDDNTIRQLWMDDNAHRSSQNNIHFIDSRHLYLNHMDPLEAVVTIWNRRIGDREQGDSSLLGATLCLWNDRRVEKDSDILRMNPVYPGMLAFAERTWRGGGRDGWIANAGDGDLAAFSAFEDRLLAQKTSFFKGKPFPYVKQAGYCWQLFGPYDNNGNPAEGFSPELTLDQREWKHYKREMGGTVVLRHWWYPLIKGAVDLPKENTTFYAFTKIWSDNDKVGLFWIGFNNLSRSPATDAPPVGAWDDKDSKVWVNGQVVQPPSWRHGGEKGDPETPLTDEGYEYRHPAKIALRKGWNTVLLKCPVGAFSGKNWQNPVKWMFTFIPAGIR